jgi:hypothetical protein
MTRTVRRLLALVLPTLALLVVPQIAVAAFSGSAAATQAVSTARLQQPTGFTGTWACESYLFQTDRARIAATSTTAANPPGTTYRYELLNGSRVVASTTTTSPTAPVNLSGTREDSRTWTLRVRPELRSWNTPWTERSFTCLALISTDGSL